MGEQAGVAVIAGGGYVTVSEPDEAKVTFRVLELGGQLRYYPIGSFRQGLQVGVEMLYVHVNAKVQEVLGVASGLAIGPFFGWKGTTSAGFTYDLQGGVAVETMGAKVTGESEPSTTSDVEIIPMVNLNIGWSF